MEFFELLGSEISELSNFFIAFSIEVNSRFVEPILELERNSSTKHLKLLARLEEGFRKAEDSKRKLIEKKNEFYQFSKLGEDNEKNLLLFVSELEQKKISKEELDVQSEKTVQFKICTAEARQTYEKAIESMNQSWGTLFSTIAPSIAEINTFEQQKRATIQTKIDQFVNFLQNCFDVHKKKPSDLKENELIFSEKLEARLKEKTLSVHKRVLAGARLSDFLSSSEKPVETFVSFADFQKIQETQNRQIESLTQKEMSTLNILAVDCFVDGIKEVSPSMQLSEHQLDWIFGKDAAIYRFLSESQNLLAEKGFYYNVHSSKFDYMERIFRSILSAKTKRLFEHDNSKLKVLDVILQIFNRVQTEDSSKKTQMLASRFKNLVFLKSIDFWFLLFEFLVELRTSNDMKRKLQGKSMINQIFSGISHMVAQEPTGDEKATLVCSPGQKSKHDSRNHRAVPDQLPAGR